MGVEGDRIGHLLLNHGRHGNQFISVGTTRFCLLLDEMRMVGITPRVCGLPVYVDPDLEPDRVMLRDFNGEILVTFENVAVSADPTMQAAARLADNALRKIGDVNRSLPSDSVIDPNADVSLPMFMGTPVRNVVIDPKPVVSREEMKRRYVQVVGVVGSGEPVAKTAEAIQREKERRRTLLEKLCAATPLLEDTRYRGSPPVVENGVGPSRWHCDTCGVGGSVATEKQAFDAGRAHYATVEHDRATETMLRGNVKTALAEVETAREALYDYLKGKGRVA